MCFLSTRFEWPGSGLIFVYDEGLSDEQRAIIPNELIFYLVSKA